MTKKKLKKELIQYKQHQEKQKLIADIVKIEKQRKNITAKSKPTKPHVKKFDEYFQECIKNKTIPSDTPHFSIKLLKELLKNTNKEEEKSALEDFAEKYTIDGEPGVTPIQYFQGKAPQIKDFFRGHRNVKVRLVLVCLMKKMIVDGLKVGHIRDKAYFHSEIHINLEATDVKETLSKMIYKILNGIATYQLNGSGWYFKEVLKLKIHTVDYKPMRGSSHIPLPDFIMKKKGDC